MVRLTTMSFCVCVSSIALAASGEPVQDARMRFEGLNPLYRTQWPDHPKTSSDAAPVAYDKWDGPYRNAAGQRWAAQINEWYQQGKAAGLFQDTFRSFDNGHSSIGLNCFPQMHYASPVENFGASSKYIFPDRVTMGVQSYGFNGMSVIESISRDFLRAYYEAKLPKPLFQLPYRVFYENNFLFVSPGVESFSATVGDCFSFLSPFYLQSIGTSSSDSRLLTPLVLASAALPPDLKTRILRNGLFVPTLMYLFKSHIAGDIKSPAAHVPAYALPAEAADGFQGPTPFLDGVLNAAHNFEHIPPVCRMRIESLSITIEGKPNPDAEAYHEDNIYAFAGALKEGQAFVLKVDLRHSWTDRDLPMASYYASVLRGQATIENLNDEKSLMNIRIPWIPTDKRRDFRTDVLLLVHDGTYYSAPAYISVRHFNRLDPILLGIKAH